ncbi:sugar kinase [Synechocystis sp. PCC 7509]|uniref:sugar kinase n=1 Tax=Synechocystis sp. PCC 7509 TaxID=927677 RepID=UPI0002AC65D9|nr:sugar kinase [Synechocystis sp. PCC 7509]
MKGDRTIRGLFVGLVTLDFVYLATCAPKSNQKIVASDYTVSAGGPATNAAATFSYLGNEANLLSVVGNHPITELVKADLATCNVELSDLAPTTNSLPPVSSVIITQGTGERAVVSINAMKTQVTSSDVATELLSRSDIVLIDGHQMAVGNAIAREAKIKNIPVVIDGGSWKQGFERILPNVDYAICSANFHPPNCNNSEQVFAYLSSFGISHIAITHGEQPIEYLSNRQIHTINVPNVKIIDTLGAGDIFHGAFCHFILFKSFADSLVEAAQIAADSCQAFGTRRWMDTKG